MIDYKTSCTEIMYILPDGKRASRRSQSSQVNVHKCSHHNVMFISSKPIFFSRLGSKLKSKNFCHYFLDVRFLVSTYCIRLLVNVCEHLDVNVCEHWPRRFPAKILQERNERRHK